MRFAVAPVLFAGLALFGCGALFGCSGEGDDELDAGFVYFDASAPRDASAPNTTILVDQVFDGDTIRVRAGSTVKAPDGQQMNGQHIRFLGVDAPEIAHPEANPPRPNPDCWGNEAAAFNQSLMMESGMVITLEFDPSHDLRDIYGRLLAYVHLRDGRVANEVLIRQGQAESYREFAHRDRTKYNELESQAKAEHLGMWASCP